jgi:spermidine synthase
MSDATDQTHARPFIGLTATTKTLHFSPDEIQSSMILRHPDRLDLEYTRMMMGFLLFKPAPANIAMIGLGGGSLAKFCYRYVPSAKICVIEINPYVIALRDEFMVPDDDGVRFEVTEADGAQFLRAPPHPYDVILVDGYDRKGLSESLSSQQFFDDCVDALEPQGLLVVNLHFGQKHYQQRVERISRSFDGAILVANDKKEGNSVVFAQKGPLPTAFRSGGVRRPVGLEESAWQSIEGAVARIQSALKDNIA